MGVMCFLLGFCYTLMSLHYYELSKLPDIINTGNNKELWLKLFKADHVAASPEFREIARLRSKARHDEGFNPLFVRAFSVFKNSPLQHNPKGLAID